MLYQIHNMRFAPDSGLYRSSNGDYLLIGIILVLAIGALWAMASHRKEDETLALIHVGAAKARVIDLSRNQIITNCIAGRMEQFEVNKGRIRVREVTCPQKSCQQRGWISRPGETIVCVPNSILIEITTRTQHPAYDAVSY